MLKLRFRWALFKAYWHLLWNRDPLTDLFITSVKSGVPYATLTAPLRDENGSIIPWLIREEARRGQSSTEPPPESQPKLKKENHSDP